MRKSAALFLAAGVTAVLAGCGAVGDPGACTSPTQAGEASELISASGAFGVEPEVSFPTPVLSDEVETSVISLGEGDVLREGDVVDIHGVSFDGVSGQAVGTTGFGEQLARFRVEEGDLLGESLQCLTVGSRAATVIPNESGATRILVADIIRSFRGKADGMPQLLESGFPSVVTAPDGTPGITIPPNTPPPTELQYQELRLGDGPEVEEGDVVVLQYTVVTWETESVVRSTWNPPLGTPEASGGSGLPVNMVANDQFLGAGFAEALIGQPVGSQVIAVIPPDAASTPAGVPAGTTMVIVFDVLGIL